MLQQLNVVELGRRRRWSEDEKLCIVMESLAGPRLVSALEDWMRVEQARLPRASDVAKAMDYMLDRCRPSPASSMTGVCA